MRFLSPVTHSETVEVLTSRLGFKLVRDVGLQTEMRRGAIHVIIRTYRESGRTMIRFHEDRFREGERHTVERSARLVRFGAELWEALKDRSQLSLKPKGWRRLRLPVSWTGAGSSMSALKRGRTGYAAYPEPLANSAGSMGGGSGRRGWRKPVVHVREGVDA